MSAIAEVQENGEILASSGAALKEVKICGVCSDKPPKYKCARCELPYCSVACATIHRTTHPPEQEPSSTPPAPPLEPAPPSNWRAGTLAAAKSGNPFAVLEISTELETLFAKYSRLKSQLRDIYAFTLPPSEGGMGMNQYAIQASNQYGGQSQDAGHRGRGGRGGRGGGRGGRENGTRGPWTTDQGMQDAIDAFGRAKEEYGKGGEGIREYADLVIKLMDNDGQDVGQIVQKEVSEENARLITQLLNGESY